MNTGKSLALLLVGVVFTLLLQSVPGAASPASGFRTGSTWLATGTVSKVDGSTIYFLGKNNVVYTIRAGDSEVVFDEFGVDSSSLSVGDTVRVYGSVIGDRTIQASRIRVCKRFADETGQGGSEKEIKVIIEKEPAAEQGQGPQCPTPAVAEPCGWTARGSIIDIDYTGHKLKIQTTQGQFTINLGNVPIVNGSRIIGLGLVNQGDTVLISGNLSGPNEVDAQQVRLTRTMSEATNTLPQRPVSVVGVIQQIDYASFTFRMQTESQDIVVTADTDTVVLKEHKRLAFLDLKPGMRVSMTGVGSIGSGFVAQQILIASVHL